ncbi:GntR family transcriptional regulator [Oculatella sp. LEGE 06141]|uniref:GntR family transcriptional regulator n=1 Tax=Oculatella sp. LEGE 06141 TaxID=1828648 RepID=UPI001882D231|nr:GntR family transcriptional regulator [Oculatella sp. LEGE 06141]MBE9180394.1 GntR family transcriptional regulator [Oculatella sp. LEGE 06141]
MSDVPHRSGSKVRAKPTEDFIYTELYNAICERQLLPDTKLGEVLLAEHYGVSRTIIRQALMRLSGDRLVKLEPNRGAFVARLTLEEARQIYAAWRLVEAEIIREVSTTITPEQVARLRALIAAERQACEAEDYPLLTRLSTQFHIQLADLCSNPFLSRFIKELIPQTSLAYFYEVRKMPLCTKDEHGEILDFIAVGDAEAAVAAAKAHLDGIEAALDARAALEPKASLADKLKSRMPSMS